MNTLSFRCIQHTATPQWPTGALFLRLASEAFLEPWCKPHDPITLAVCKSENLLPYGEFQALRCGSRLHTATVASKSLHS